MRVVLILPDEDCSPEELELEQRLAGLRCRFPGAEIVTVAGRDAGPLLDRLGADDRIAVLGEGGAVPRSPSPQRADCHRTCRVFVTGQVLPAPGTALEHEDCPALETHAFSRAAPRAPGDLACACFHFFPYGYLYRLIGLGPTDAFGHRITQDFRRLRTRSPDHRLVACFGGSAVWSIATTPEQSFPQVLEDVLNARARQDGRALRFTVLNFGVPGAVVLNSMQRYLLFAADLAPDFVIAHDGVNDLFYGCTSDPWLLGEHGIAYQQQLDYWAAMLHDPDFRGNANLGGPLASPSGVMPVTILRAYVRRKREFMTMVRGFGGRFVWGQQPFAWSKAALSPREQARIRARSGTPLAYEAEFRTVRGLFDLVRPRLAGFGADATVDFDEEFRGLGAQDTVMADMVHLEPRGDRVIAERYARSLWALLPPDEGGAVGKDATRD